MLCHILAVSCYTFINHTAPPHWEALGPQTAHTTLLTDFDYALYTAVVFAFPRIPYVTSTTASFTRLYRTNTNTLPLHFIKLHPIKDMSHTFCSDTRCCILSVAALAGARLTVV